MRKLPGKKIFQEKPSITVADILNVNYTYEWTNEFNPPEILSSLQEYIKIFVAMEDRDALIVALWVMHSWCCEESLRCPLLLINAPERECGKTQLLKIVQKLVPKPFETANITLAGLFRIISNYAPTLLIDEADTFMEGKAEMQGIINKGYERGGVVLRIESDGLRMKECVYQVYGPKVLAGIMLERHLPDATMSRGIQIPLRRKPRSVSVESLRNVSDSACSGMRSRMRFFAELNKAAIAQGCQWESMPSSLSDRQKDNWEPLLAVARCCGEEWYQKALEAALQNCSETSPPKSSANQLLEDIREVLMGYEGNYIPSADLLEKLHEHPDMDWSTYNRGQPITARQLAKFMSAYGIKSKTVRMKEGYTPKGYEVREFGDAFTRYLAEREDDPVEEKKTPPANWKPTRPNF
ncbi:DUF3631 domain-containing protein [Comamonas jiangduensis]|uniref:DUF3631 domain-containing protein n=1 Tax=Comamonas jiangduensis TaxID=1194168 RepID=UPI003BF83429